MAVMLPNAQITAHVRSHAWTRDAHGTPVPTGTDTITARGPFPCNLVRKDGGEAWACRLDPRMDPLRPGDELTDGDRVWTIGPGVTFHEIPGCSYIDYIEATAVLNVPEVP